jgi:hypothetical protein
MTLLDALTTINNSYGRGDIVKVMKYHDAKREITYGVAACRLQYGMDMARFTIMRNDKNKRVLHFRGRSKNL